MAEESKSDRVKFVYNAQFPSSTAVVLDYLINNDVFASRQGRQRAMDAIAAFYRPLAEKEQGEMSEEQVQAVAGVCVEQLVKQIDTLCELTSQRFAIATSFPIPSPVVQVQRLFWATD